MPHSPPLLQTLFSMFYVKTNLMFSTNLNILGFVNSEQAFLFIFLCVTGQNGERACVFSHLLSLHKRLLLCDPLAVSFLMVCFFFTSYYDQRAPHQHCLLFILSRYYSWL